MREEKLKSIRKFGKIGYIATTIMMCLIIAITVIFTIVLSIIHSNFKQAEKLTYTTETSANITINRHLTAEDIKDLPINVHIDELEAELDKSNIEHKDGKTIIKLNDSDSKEVNLPSLAKFLIAPLGSLILLAVNHMLFRNVFKELRDGASPFTQELVRKLKLFAYSVIPWTLLGNVYEILKKTVLLKGEVNYSIDFTAVIIVAMIFVIIKIFEYGIDLQIESDDTV